MDVEAVDSVHALEFLESIQRHFTRTRDELQKLGAFFLVKGSHRTPEPLDLGRRRRVVLVFRVALPVVHVNVRQARDEQLQLLFVEDGNEVGRNDFVEACAVLATARNSLDES